MVLSLTPIIFGVLAGFPPERLSEFFIKGISAVTPIAVMFIFAILFFALMQEQRLFDPLINGVIRRAQRRLTLLSMATVLIASIAHLDGSGASTFLICIPALLPVYQRLRVSPYLLLLLVSASASVMNMLPWGGPLGRAASVINSDSATLWRALVPIQVGAFFLLLLGAYWLGRREAREISKLDQSSHRSESPEEERVEIESDLDADSETKPNLALPRELPQDEGLSRAWWLNATLTTGVISLLLSGLFPSALVFMLALAISFLVNRLDQDAQRAFLSRHAWSALQMAMIIFAAGVFLGVLRESLMLRALAGDLMIVLPESLHSKLHLIVGVFGAPLELLLNTDAYYFALLPLVTEVVAPHGVSGESVVYSMLIGNIVGTFISPFSPALWLGLGLANLDMGRHIRYSIGWIWGLSLALMGLGWMCGLY